MHSHCKEEDGPYAIRSHWEVEAAVPKQVDHQARREQIAEAAFRLAGTQGLDAVSLRHVAAEAGVSMGLVQHYFTTKDELLLFAFHTLSQRVEQRIAAALGGAPPSGPRSLLRTLLTELLPLTDEARREAPVWIAFLARAVVEPRLADTLRAGDKSMREFVSEQIRTAQRAGDTPAHIDPAREATTLLALADGLMSHVLMGQLDAAAALSTLDYYLHRIFP
jgi:TetR/AcrR family transcriptional regulator, transcriptional repressor of bet genes